MKGVVLVVVGVVVIILAVALLGFLTEEGALRERVERLAGVVQGLERSALLAEGQWCVDAEARLESLEYWLEETWRWVGRVDDLLTEHKEGTE